MKKTKSYLKIISVIAALLVSVSCSTAPKNPTDDFTLRSQAEASLNLGNTEADRNNYDTALMLLTESRQKAILADDPSLMIRTGLSLGNVLFALGREDEAFSQWQIALDEAERFADRELLSVSKIHFARGRLLSGKQSAQAVLDEVNRESSSIKSDKLYVAFSWYVKGLALRELGSLREAEDAIKRSLDIHEKDKYLLRAAYDWYLIASIRSTAGNTDGALQALNSAIVLDRRMENSWGLAADWRAMGDIYRKTGKTREAREAYLHAKAIFLSLGDEKGAEEIENRMNN